MVIFLAHIHPMAGHLTTEHTQRLRDLFHWPGINAGLSWFCQACPVLCVKELPLRSQPWPHWCHFLLLRCHSGGSRRAVDQVSSGSWAYSSNFQLCHPLPMQRPSPTAAAIAQELLQLCNQLGIPTEILTDQGIPFVSWITADLFKLLKVKHIQTSVYHLQTGESVEQFNRILK